MELQSLNEPPHLPSVEYAGIPAPASSSDEKKVLSHKPTDVLEEYEIVTPFGVPLRVYRKPSTAKSAIITYHDIGTNHTMFLGFFQYPEMQVLTRNFAIYHVCAPGHHEGAENITNAGAEATSLLQSPSNNENVSTTTTIKTSDSASIGSGLFERQSAYQNVTAEEDVGGVAKDGQISAYPTMDELAEMLTTVVDYFKIDYFIGFGMGAGSNVLSRYALRHPEHVLALFLINPNATTHSYYEYYRNQWSDIPNLQRGIFTDSLLSQLEAHWFGYGQAQNEDLVAYYTQLAHSLNPVNLAGYINSYVSRTDLGLVRCLDPLSVIEQREKEAANPVVPTAIKVDCCLVTGALAQDLSRALSEMNGRMDPRRTQFLLVPDCNGFLMEEDPDKLAVNFLHFLRNEGYLVNMTPEKLRQEASVLQIEMAQSANAALPSTAFLMEQEA